MKKKTIMLSLSAAMALGMSTAAMAGGTLKFGCQVYSDGLLDPISMTNAAWNSMRYGIGECLFKFDDSMSVEGWLAESAEANEDYTVWTITLKEGIKFSDGCDLTPSKVKECFDRALEEGPNGSASVESYLPYDSIVTADDAANTITIELSASNQFLPGNLCYPVMQIIDVADITDFDNGVIGTGPYAVSEFKPNVGYDMVKNENYREEVPYDAVEILYLSDSAGKADALRAGQVDLVENVTNPAQLQELVDDENYTVDVANGVRCGFAWMNQNGILGNETLRKAILMAMDKEKFCSSNLIGGLYTAGCSVLPSNLPYGYENLTDTTAYDPEGAMALLDEAGIVDTDGDGIRELDGENIVLNYAYYDNRLLKEFAQIHHMYLNQIGIEVNEVEYDDVWNALATGDYDLGANNWTTVGNGDPSSYLNNWYSESSQNFCGYKNEEYDALHEQLAETFDTQERAQIIERMQQILIDDAAVLIDGYYNSSMVYSKNVATAHIHTADYYWLSTEITPAE